MTPSICPCSLSRSSHIRLKSANYPAPIPFLCLVLLQSAAEGLLQNYGTVPTECTKQFSSILVHSELYLQIVGTVRLRVIYLSVLATHLESTGTT